MRWLLPSALLGRIPRRAILLAVLLGLGSAAANVGMSVLVQATLAHRLSTPQAGLGLLVAALALVCTTYASQSIMVRAAYRSISDLRIELCRSILELPLQRIEALGAPEILGVIIGDVQTLKMATLGIQDTIVSLCIFGGCTAYLIWLSPQATAIFTAVGAVSWLVASRLQARGVRLHVKARLHESSLLSQLSTIVHGAKELKLNAAHADELLRADVSPVADQILGLQIGGQQSWLLQRITVQLGFLAGLGVLLIGPRWTSEISTQTAFVLTLLLAAGQLSKLADWFPEVARANTVFARIQALGVRMNAPLHGLDDAPLRIAEQIDLVQVGHTYRADTEAGDRAFVLGPLDLTVRRGEILFIVGGNGSGKSTLVKILSGLYWPERGAIHVDGRAIDEGRWRAYRANFSAIFSDFQLFDRLFDPDAERIDQATAYLTRLRLKHRVRIEGTRLLTTGLSQGQRKRLALVRAYLEDRAIYIFDEWAADQDPTWKDLFYRELLPELRDRGKAVIVISHDDRYFDVADRLIKLDEGQIIEASGDVRQQGGYRS